MTQLHLMNYRVGLIGKLIALLTGIAALGWYFSQGELGELTEKIFITVALTGMLMAIFSRERHEDERTDLIRLRVALMVIGGFLGTFVLVGMWITANSEQGLSLPGYSLFALGTYVIGLEIYKRVV